MAQLLSQIKIHLFLTALAGVIITALLASAASAMDKSAPSDAIIYAQDYVVLEHKLDNHINRNTDYDDDMSWEEYETSQQAQVSKHANRFIAKAYGRE